MTSSDQLPSLEYLLQRCQSLREYGRKALVSARHVRRLQSHLEMQSDLELQLLGSIVICCTKERDNLPLTGLGKVFAQVSERCLAIRQQELVQWSRVEDELQLLNRLFVRDDSLGLDCKRAQTQRKALEAKLKRYQRKSASLCASWVGWIGGRLSLSPGSSRLVDNCVGNETTNSTQNSLNRRTPSPTGIQISPPIRSNSLSSPPPPPSSPALSSSTSVSNALAPSVTDLTRRLQVAIELDETLRQRMFGRCLNEEYATMVRLYKIAQLLSEGGQQHALQINELSQWLLRILQHLVPDHVHHLNDQQLELFFRPMGPIWRRQKEATKPLSATVEPKPTVVQNQVEQPIQRQTSELASIQSYSSRVSHRPQLDSNRSMTKSGDSVLSAWSATHSEQPVNMLLRPTADKSSQATKSVQTQTESIADGRHSSSSPEPQPQRLDNRRSDETTNMSLNSLNGRECCLSTKPKYVDKINCQLLQHFQSNPTKQINDISTASAPPAYPFDDCGSALTDSNLPPQHLNNQSINRTTAASAAAVGRQQNSYDHPKQAHRVTINSCAAHGGCCVHQNAQLRLEQLIQPQQSSFANAFNVYQVPGRDAQTRQATVQATDYNYNQPAPQMLSLPTTPAMPNMEMLQNDAFHTRSTAVPVAKAQHQRPILPAACATEFVSGYQYNQQDNIKFPYTPYEGMMPTNTASKRPDVALQSFCQQEEWQRPNGQIQQQDGYKPLSGDHSRDFIFERQ